MKFTKPILDLSSQHCKMQMKEIKESVSEWRDIQFSGNRRQYGKDIHSQIDL